jgi:hypothetical protein
MADVGSHGGSLPHSPKATTPACYGVLTTNRGVASSPSAESTQSNDSASDEPELKPFPTDTFSEEILHLILYHVLTEPNFGKNGKWASREEAKQDKLQFASAHKVSSVLSLLWGPSMLKVSLALSSNGPRYIASFASSIVHGHPTYSARSTGLRD